MQHIHVPGRKRNRKEGKEDFHLQELSMEDKTKHLKELFYWHLIFLAGLGGGGAEAPK